MKITSAIVSLLSDFVFGLIPVPEMVNWIFNLTASDETKKSMEEGRGFVEKRAKILGVDSKRLTEYETRNFDHTCQCLLYAKNLKDCNWFSSLQ